MLLKYTNPNLAYRTMQPYAPCIGSAYLTFWIIMEIYTLRASERPYDAFLDPIHPWRFGWGVSPWRFGGGRALYDGLRAQLHMKV